MPTDQEEAFITAWRNAGPVLQRIRNEELKNLAPAEGTRIATWLGLSRPYTAPLTSGLQEYRKLLDRDRAMRHDSH